MDPQLFDILWEVYRDVDGKQPIPSSPPTARPPPTRCCAAARAASPSFSQHMLGNAMDFYIPGVALEQTSRGRAAPAARRRRLLSDPARPSCISTPAASATGRA